MGGESVGQCSICLGPGKGWAPQAVLATPPGKGEKAWECKLTAFTHSQALLSQSGQAHPWNNQLPGPLGQQDRGLPAPPVKSHATPDH